MKYRTTFSLDEDAIKRLRLLASRWNVSKAEVIRRALKKAEKELELSETDPYEVLSSYHDDGGFAKETALEYIDEIYSDRSRWRGT